MFVESVVEDFAYDLIITLIHHEFVFQACGKKEHTKRKKKCQVLV
jgi:hypothetical protein